MLIRRRHEPLARYSLAVLCPLICIPIDRLLGLGILQDTPFLLLFLGVLVSAWYGGIGPGLLSTVITFFIVVIFHLEPIGVFEIDSAHIARLAIFIAVGVLISLLGAARLTAESELKARQEELEITLSSIGDAVIATDTNGVVTFLNPVAARLVGWIRQEAVGRPMEEIFVIINESTREPVESPVARVLREGVVVGLANHTVLVARDGTETPIDDSAAPIRSETGEMRGVVLVFHDISERRRQERLRAELLDALQNERERIDDLISSVPGVVWEAWGEPDAAAQRIDFVSEYVESMLGYSREEWHSEPNFWLKVVHPDDRERAAAEAAAIFNAGNIGQSQFRWRARNGRTIWVEAHSMVVRDDAGRPVGMRGVTMDITERKRAEQEMRQAMEAAEAANLAKNNFLAMLSHELRTPLTPVFTAAHLLAEARGLSQEDQDLVAMIRQSVELEARLIDDLLELTRIDQGKLHLSVGPLDLHDVVVNALAFCQQELIENDQTVDLELDAEASWIEGDAARLQQVFWNLIKNAVKFSRPGGGIDIRTMNPSPEIVRISVIDHGIGIESEHLTRIFRPFEQAEATITRRYGGLGLGLAITSAIVRLHGGTIEAASPGPDQGATFSIDLPTSRIDGLAPSNGEFPSDDDEQSFSALRILLVESDTGVLGPLLANQGYQIYTAGSADAALEIAGRHYPDVVIVDSAETSRETIEMAIGLVGALCENSPIHTIMIGETLPENVLEEVQSSGIEEYLVRPITHNLLRGAIHRVVG